MKKIDNINILRLQVCPFGCNEPLYYDYKGYDQFDDRNHYLINSETEYLGVLLSFSFEEDITFLEIRRTEIAVNIYESKSEKLLCSKTISNIIGCKNYRLDMPFEYTDIKGDTTYVVKVVNMLSQRTIGCKRFCVYDSDKTELSPVHWYSVLCGAVTKICDAGYMQMFRNLYDISRNRDKFGIRFYVRNNNAERIFEYLPELEIRIYYPDGRVKSTFCDVSEDESFGNLEYVETAFNVEIYTEGFYFYAELLFMGIRISGFVFKTGEYEEGLWEGEDMSYIVGYNPAVRDGFKYLMRQQNDEIWQNFDSDHNTYVFPE